MSSESESPAVTAILCPPSRPAARKIRGFRDGFEEPLADRLNLVREGTGPNEGAIDPANQVAHFVRMGQPESRGQLPERHWRQLPPQPGT